MESIGSGADGSDPGVFDTTDDAANCGELVEFAVEFCAVDVTGVLASHTVLDVALVEIVAQRDFATEGIAAVFQLHAIERVVTGLNQDRDVKFGQIDGRSHTDFVAEVGQDHEDAVNFILVGFEQLGTGFGVFVGHDRAEWRLIFAQDDGFDALGCKLGQDFLAFLTDQMIWEKLRLVMMTPSVVGFMDGLLL